MPLNPNAMPPWAASPSSSPWLSGGLYANPTPQGAYQPAPSPFGSLGGPLTNWNSPVPFAPQILDLLLGHTPTTTTPASTPGTSPAINTTASAPTSGGGDPSGTPGGAGGVPGVTTGVAGGPEGMGSAGGAATGVGNTGTAGSGPQSSTAVNGFVGGFATPAGTFGGNLPGQNYGFSLTGPSSTQGLFGQQTGLGTIGNFALNAATMGIPAIGLLNSALGMIAPNVALQNRAAELNQLTTEYPGLAPSTGSTTGSPSLAQAVASNMAAFGNPYGGVNAPFGPTQLAQSNLPQGTRAKDVENAMKALQPKGQDTTNCFPGETLVLMGTGTYRPIKAIKVGDELISYNWKNKAVEPQKVLRLRKRAEEHTFIMLNERLWVTGRHKFAVPIFDDIWVRAQQIQREDVLLGLTGPILVETVQTITTDPLPVYNLSVAHNHNFFVSDGTSTYLVHNGGGGAGGGGGADGPAGSTGEPGAVGGQGAAAAVGATGPASPGPPGSTGEPAGVAGIGSVNAMNDPGPPGPADDKA